MTTLAMNPSELLAAIRSDLVRAAELGRNLDAMQDALDEIALPCDRVRLARVERPNALGRHARRHHRPRRRPGPRLARKCVLTNHERLARIHAAGRRYDARERVARERALNEPDPPPVEPSTAKQIAEAAEASARRGEALPWWERQTQAERAASEAAAKLSRYLSC